MTHEEKIARWIDTGALGCEIGPGHAPIPGFSPAPIYIECFKAFGNEPCRGDYYGHACSLPFHSNTLDYVASSHVLEHVANPVAALAEWYRVLRPGGMIYLVVPHRLTTWDRTRPLTKVEHLLEDFQRGTSACDATHIDDFVQNADWSLFAPHVSLENLAAEKEALARGMHEAVSRGEDINIHFHTFEPDSLRGLFETLRTWKLKRFNWEVVDVTEGFPVTSPNGIFVAVRVLKGWYDRAQADAFDVTAGDDRRAAVVREDAVRFEDFVKSSGGNGGVR